MELTRRQEEGLRLAIDRYLARERYTVISGYAGSGKSTLVKFIIAALSSHGVNPDKDVAYACYTGKAAQVLIDKGNEGATTLHKLLYKAKLMKNGKYKFDPIDRISYKIVVVDECSMAPRTLVEQLLKHTNTHVIFMGDPGQLPPIYTDEDNHLLDHPHVFLDEIMRQAQESGIIRLSMKIREGEDFKGFMSDEARVYSRKEYVSGMIDWADQILCATNKTRNDLNTACRQHLGYTNPIEENEKIICLRNYWDELSPGGAALTNGSIGYLRNYFDSALYYPRSVYQDSKIPVLMGDFVSDTGEMFHSLYIDKKQLLSGNPTLDGTQLYKAKKKELIVPYEFGYGYAITVWKAQGSEWNKVLGFEEGHPFAKPDHIKYLYTLVTRASDKCVLITKN